MIARRSHDLAATLGHPSYVWRAGQERRLNLIKQWAQIREAKILVDGAGIGMYSRHLAALGAQVISLDVDHSSMKTARQVLPYCVVGACESLPFADRYFDIVLSHEVIEHVVDDRQTLAEIARVLRPGGRLVLFAPNRLYPFETHGHYWRGNYHFGNTPLINWLPNFVRDKLAPHVRAYTPRSLRRLFEENSFQILYHSQIYPGYDNIIYRFPRLGTWIRAFTYWLERTPLRIFGISHFIVAEKR